MAKGGDRILLRGLVFYGRHGALPEEQVLGQRFRVDVDLRLDLRRAGATDDLGDTVNYAEVHSLVQGVMEGPPVRLLERAASMIAIGVLGEHPAVTDVTVAIHKPSVPIPAALDYVGVEISRSRSEGG